MRGEPGIGEGNSSGNIPPMKHNYVAATNHVHCQSLSAYNPKVDQI